MGRRPPPQGRPVRDRRADAVRPVGELSGDEQELVVLVDAENARRSQWPNVSLEEFTERARAWAKRAGARIVVVADGRDPRASGPDVVYTGDESADDWIARRADELAAASQPYWLVTSDRELRARAGARAQRTVGGGSFVRELGA